jgi:radical SAM protein with 4Fe4S-binding SPASM domain
MPDSTEYLELQKKLDTLPCKGIYGTFSIFCDGSAPICGVDVNQDYIAGDLNDQSIKEIWTGRLYTEFRMKQLEFGREAYSHCRKCNSWAPELKLAEISK